jgi:transcriptional regulator with XRE-family HTH domain
VNHKSLLIEPNSKCFRNKVGESIKVFRGKKGYSQNELAALMQVSRSTISKIENGRFSISIDYLEKFSVILEFDLQLKIQK